MAEKLFEVSLLEEVLAGFGWEEAEVPGKLREALVMELLRRDDVTEAQAAELALRRLSTFAFSNPSYS
jgi:hypothetical protein